jgi:Fe2+ or Zn2+ uptake regulation protein
MDGKRNTIQRQLILDALKELDIHATAEQVFDYVVRKYPSISKATVYRNLGSMSESGEVINIGSFYGSAHFDHNCHDHYHFVCETCKRVFDVKGGFHDIFDRIKDLNGFDITGCSVSFRGLCRDCKEGVG